MRTSGFILPAVLLLAAPDYTLADARALIQAHCAKCHQAKSAAGGVNLATLASIGERASVWSKAAAPRVACASV